MVARAPENVPGPGDGAGGDYLARSDVAKAVEKLNEVAADAFREVAFCRHDRDAASASV